ncbi:17113_t:CDS:2 [Gigaspora margarita]|uniref:17113_t:CDS:1 n=1 Tax=Gigaspora margarita TaxID=4874 RepID=A0ABN7UBE3_GIGMA|nr:17113_t:CDS:2 [Gigaspora margarita]
MDKRKKKELEIKKTTMKDCYKNSKAFEVNDEETWRTKKDERGKVEDDNNGRVITEIEEINCTDYSGTRIRKTNKVDDIINQEWKENEPNKVVNNKYKMIAEMNYATHDEFKLKKEKKTILIKTRKLQILMEVNYAGKIKGPEVCWNRSEVEKDGCEIVEWNENNREKNNKIEIDKEEHKTCIEISRSFKVDNSKEPHNLGLQQKME